MGNPGSNINECLGEYIFFLNPAASSYILSSKNRFAFLFSPRLSLVIWKSKCWQKPWPPVLLMCDIPSETNKHAVTFIVASRQSQGVDMEQSLTELDWPGHFVVVKMSPMRKSGMLVIFGIQSLTEYINVTFLWRQRILQVPEKALRDMSLF